MDNQYKSLCILLKRIKPICLLHNDISPYNINLIELKYLIVIRRKKVHLYENFFLLNLYINLILVQYKFYIFIGKYIFHLDFKL